MCATIRVARVISNLTLILRGLLPIILFAATHVASAAAPTEAVSTESIRTENDVFNEKGLAAVDAFSGNLTSSSRDIYIEGTGGNPIAVYRRYDGSRMRARIWGGLMEGVSYPAYAPQDQLLLGPSSAGWSLTAAPVLDISVAKRWSESLPLDMTDDLDKVCTGQPFRADGTSGAYGTVIIYSLTLPDGQVENLVPLQTGLLQTRSGWRLTCVGGRGGVHMLQGPNGDRYTLDKRIENYLQSPADNSSIATLTYTATRRVDRNDNWLAFEYTDFVTTNQGFKVPRPFLTRIASSDGRRLDFGYLTADDGARRLSKITSNSGAAWSYYYDADGPLSAFVDPVGRAWTYEYYPGIPFDKNLTLRLGGGHTHAQPAWAASGNIRKITLPTGGSIAFRYEPSEVWGRGVWWWEGMLPEQMAIYSANNYFEYPDELLDVRANWSLRVKTKETSDGGVWTYDYAPSKSAGAYDVTTIQTPSGTEVHKFIGEGYFLNENEWTTQQGYRGDMVFYYRYTPLLNGVWKLGLPVEIQKGSNYTETFAWSPLLHSAIFFAATSGVVGLRDDETYRPVLSQHTVVVDGARHTTTYSNYDTFGNPGTVAEEGPNGGNRTVNKTYVNNTDKWILGLPKDDISAQTATTRNYDLKGNLVSFFQDGIATSYTYYADGSLESKTMPRGLVHGYANYKLGIAQTEVQPEGVTLTRAVDDAGNVVSETDGEGRTKAYTYDAVNRVTSVTYPSGNAKRIAYTPTSKVATRGDLVESTLYDAFGRLASLTLGGITTSYAHDALGRKVFESFPGSTLGTTYQYDALDRVTFVGNADGTHRSNAYGPATESITDERGITTTQGFRAYGDYNDRHLMYVTAPEPSASLALTRNARDLVTSMTQAGYTREYGYDGNYRLTTVRNPETGLTVYGRDDAGNMTSRSVGGSHPTYFAYDGQNRLVSSTVPGDPAPTIQAYDRTNRITRSTASNGIARAFAYDANGNLTSESLAVDGGNFVAQYGYTANDQLASITYPVSGRTVYYSPDVLGRPTQVSGFVSNVSYWPSGQVRDIQYANGDVTSYGQNSRQWPSSFVSSHTGATHISTSYGYDGVGNLTSIADAVDPALSRRLAYDAVNRLTNADGPWGSGTLTYDGAGNLRSQTLGATTISYAYDGPTNRLTSSSGSRSEAYAYDVYGNVVNAGARLHAYDEASNLICASCNDPGAKSWYRYDGLNKRVSLDKLGARTYEFYASSGNLLTDYTAGAGTGTRLVEYIYLGSQRVAQVDPAATTVSTSASGTISFVAGRQVVLVATVNGNSPSGTISYYNGNTLLGTATLAGGSAAVPITLAQPGTYTLTVVYSGDALNAQSTSTVTVTVLMPPERLLQIIQLLLD